MAYQNPNGNYYQGQQPEQYRGQPAQGGWSNAGAGGQYYDQRSQQGAYANQNYGQQSNGYQNAGHDQGQHRQDTYQQPAQTQQQYDNRQYQQPAQSEQQYQYDPRYREHGQSSREQVDQRQYQDRRPRQTDERQHQQVEPKVQKPRERILPTKEPTLAVPWDSPFPVFNLKQKNTKKKHSSLERDMSGAQLSDAPQQRSQTSQSHRRGEESRPHTSQGHRRPVPQFQQTDTYDPRSQPPSSAARQANGYDANTNGMNPRNVSDGQMNSRPALNRIATEGMAPPMASHQESHSAPPRMAPPLQRSMTMPDPVPEAAAPNKLHKLATAQRSREVSGNSPHPEQPYSYVPSPISPGSVPPPTPAITERLAPIMAVQQAQQAVISPEMPNFDLISPSVNEKTEDPLAVPVKPTAPKQIIPDLQPAAPAYKKAAYQATTAAPSLPRSNSQPRMAKEANHPDFGGFSFDLPSSGSQAPGEGTTQAGYNQISPKTTGVPPQVGQSQEPAYTAPRQDHLPPRTASRQAQHQPPPANAGQYGTREAPQQYRSASEPHDPYGQRSDPYANRSSPEQRDPGYGYGQQQYGGHSNSEPSAAGVQHRPPQSATNYYQEQRQYSAAVDPRLQRSGTPTSAQSVPSRPYDSRVPSNPSNPSKPLNPDALPAHPTPARPNLLQKASAASTVSTMSTMTTMSSQTARDGARTPSNPPPAPKPSTEKKDPPITPYDLNLLVQTIRSNNQDYRTMFTLAKKLVEAASVLANEGGLADPKTAQKNRERYILDAHKYLKKLVNAGHPEAMFYLAECHGSGALGLAVDPKEAFTLYMSSAKAGYAQAAYRVAVCCEMGNEDGGGTRRDPLKAFQWYKRAAAMGDPPAMYKLGIILLKGLLGQPRSPRDGVSWLKRAADKADKDNPHALHELGLLYESASPSDAIVRDEAYACQLFTQAAELGYKYAQFKLGSASEYGALGFPIDARQSIAWYTRAAAQGEHQAELALSGWYLTGSDGILQQSDTEAFLWARKAASSGLAKAEFAMGYFTETGIGCTASLEEAKKWYWRAAAQQFPKARERLEELKRGGGKMVKTRVSRSAFNRQSDSECRIM